MTAEFKFYSAGAPDEIYRYHLRRQDGPEWQILLTTESFTEHRTRISTLDDSNMLLTTREKQLRELDDECRWRPARQDHQGDIEMRYQLFLRLARAA